MAVQIINAGSNPAGAVGSQYGLLVNQDGSLNIGQVAGSIGTYGGGIGSTVLSGTSIIAGSVAITTNPVPISGALGNVAGSFALTTGSINTYGTVSIIDSSVYAVSGIIASLGSLQLFGANFNGSVFSTRLDSAGSHLMVAGSISSIPQIVGSVRQVNEPWIVTGSVLPYGVGSVRIAEQGLNLQVYNSGLFSIVGSLSSIPAWTGIGSATSVITAGSVIVTNTVAVSGVLTNLAGSFAITTTTLGSVRILSNPVPISGIVNIGAGSTLVYGVSGATAYALQTTSGVSGIGFLVTNINTWPGSVAITTTPIPVSGTSLLVSGAGTFQVSGTAFNTVWVGIGSIRFGQEPSIITGSVQPYNPIGVGSIYGIGIGSIAVSVITPATIGSFTTQTIAGSINILSDPVPISGGVIIRAGSIQTYTPLGVGSVVISGGVLGSVAVTNLALIGSVRPAEIPFPVEQNRGVFSFSGVSFIGSFTGSNILTPGTGSKVLLKGFNASAEIATKFRIFFSGGTSTDYGTYHLANSGVMAFNLMGMEPSGAVNQPLAISLLNAGSLFFTAHTSFAV